MNVAGGELLNLLGLLEGRSSAAEREELRARLAADRDLRRRWQQLQRAAERVDEGEVPPVDETVSAETMAAFADGLLAAEECRTVERAIWESEALLVEMVSTYRATDGEPTSPASVEPSERLLGLFPAAEASVRGETAVAEAPAVSVESPTEPDDVPIEKRRPPRVRSRRRTTATKPGHHRRAVVVAVGIGVIVGAVAFASFWWGPAAPPPIARDEPSDDRDPLDDSDETIEADDGRLLAGTLEPTIVGALLRRTEQGRWTTVDSAIHTGEPTSLRVPPGAWARLDAVAGERSRASIVLSGPANVLLGAAPQQQDEPWHVAVRSGRVALDRTDGVPPIHVDVDGETVVMADASAVSILANETATVASVRRGTIAIDGRPADTGTAVRRARGGEWSPVNAPPDGWRGRPESPPANVTRLAERVRGADDVVEVLLATARDRESPARVAAARWALSLDPGRTAATVVREVDEGRFVLFTALAGRNAGLAITRPLWRELGETTGDPRSAALLEQWHSLAMSRTPLDADAARGLLRGLGHSHVVVRSVAIRTLRLKTGFRGPYDPRAPKAERTRSIQLWTRELRRRFPNAEPSRS